MASTAAIAPAFHEKPGAKEHGLEIATRDTRIRMYRASRRWAYTRMPGVHVHPHDVHGGPRLDVVAGANRESHCVCIKMPVWVFMSIHV